MLVAAPRADVDIHVERLHQAGLYPVVVDLPNLAVCNLYGLLRGGGADGAGAVCLVHLSRRHAHMAIRNGNDAVYLRSFFSPAAAMDEAGDYLARNIRDGIRYYEQKLKSGSVQTLVFTGDLPREAEERVLEEVRGKVGLPVSLWNPLADMAVPSRALRRRLEQEPSIGPALAVSLGLALRNA